MEKKKKLLLMSDDLRMHSGISRMSMELVLGTIGKYDWIQMAGSIKHPDTGKILDMNDAVRKETGIEDASLKLYPVDEYGNADILRNIMMAEKIDGIVHFTDPRFWIWLYSIEREIRQYVPLMYYTIWDDIPYPQYNKPYYESCDWLGCISKQTENLVKSILPNYAPWQITYVPHGINSKMYRPVDLELEEDVTALSVRKKALFGTKKYDFVVYYSNRNVRRKRTADVILAYRGFCENLSKEEANKCVLLMHTDKIDNNGTDLPAVVEALCPDYDVVFSTDKIHPKDINLHYSIADVTISLSSNEGFGLATAESLMAGTPIITTVTGGLQDQCGFTDDEGKPIQFTPEWGTNADGKFKNHGEWVTPLYPKVRMLQGSPPTPYIFDDFCAWEDASEAIMYWYLCGKEKRKKAGLAGRQFMFDSGLTAENMCAKFVEGAEGTFTNWKPRNRISIHTTEEYTGHKMKDIGFSFPKIDVEKIKNEILVEAK